MTFARTVYRIAAVYGFVVLTPLYFMTGRIARDAPPPITHPEFYYGFVGLALLWQVVFLLIAANPARYRTLMLPAILEKFVYTVPVVILYLLGRAAPMILIPSLADPVLGVLFIIAYLRTPRDEQG
jgi:hypothetical protein